MPAKRIHCSYGHDWRVSFDDRFYYCYYCSAKWSRDDHSGQAPSPNTYTQYPSMPRWASGNQQPQGANTVANTQRALDILGDTTDDYSDNGDSGQASAEWVSPEDILYQRIVVTRANIADKFDQAYNRNRTFAYVNFYFYDDEDQRPFVFRSGWPRLRKQIGALIVAKTEGDNPFPVECGLTEILTRSPLRGDDGGTHFPLQLLPFEALDEAETAATSFSLKANLATEAEKPPQAAPAVRVASNASPAPTAATAGKKSVARPNSLNNRGN